KNTKIITANCSHNHSSRRTLPHLLPGAFFLLPDDGDAVGLANETDVGDRVWCNWSALPSASCGVLRCGSSPSVSSSSSYPSSSSSSSYSVVSNDESPNAPSSVYSS